MATGKRRIWSMGLSPIQAIGAVLAVAMAACTSNSAQVDNQLLAENDTQTHVVYGEDNRAEVFAYGDRTLANRLVDWTVALMSPSAINASDPDGVTFRANTLGRDEDLCSDERFWSQPTAARCSGTLIAPDLVLTAGHCVETATDCSNTRVVFNYHYVNTGRFATVTTNDIFSCDELVVQELIGNVDHAILRLDREAAGHAVAPLRRADTAVDADADVYVAGYPSGLPMKIADSAEVRDNQGSDLEFYVANLDTFVGNSGSGVYLEATDQLAGILVSGETDYVASTEWVTDAKGKRVERACNRVNVCAEDGCHGEQSSYLFRALDALCEETPDDELCHLDGTSPTPIPSPSPAPNPSPSQSPDAGLSPDPCNGETYEGRCDGDQTIRCEDDQVQNQACGDIGRTCGWNVSKEYYDCVDSSTPSPTRSQSPDAGPSPDPCNGETHEGRCDGDRNIWRKNDQVRRRLARGPRVSPEDQGEARKDGAPPDAVHADEPQLQGSLRVRLSDNWQTRKTSRLYRLATDSGADVELRFTDDPRLPAGVKASFWGYWLEEGIFSVSDWRLGPQFRRLDEPVVREPKEHRLAVLLMQDVSLSEDDVYKHMQTVREFYTDVTDGIDTFSCDLVRRYDIEYSNKTCDWDTGTVENDLISAFEADGYDPSEYEHIAVIVNAECGASWGGAAWAYVGALRDDGTLECQQLSAYPDDPQRDPAEWPWWFAHEFGHNLAMGDSNSADCGQDLYREGLQNCQIFSYGDSNDVMGWGGAIYFNTPNQRFMGWVGAEHVVTARSSGLYNLQPADAAVECGIQALRVPIAGETGVYFYLEYRRPRSDSRWAGAGWVGERNAPVLLYRSHDYPGDYSKVLRIELGTSEFEGATVGEHHNLGEGISFKVESVGTYARVSLQMSAQGETSDDNGNPVAPESDGSIGSVSCGEQPGAGENDDTGGAIEPDDNDNVGNSNPADSPRDDAGGAAGDGSGDALPPTNGGCDCSERGGTGGGLWMLALAVALKLRSRRRARSS